MHFLELPNEVLLNIFSYGGPKALLGGLSQTCHLLRAISNDSELWREILLPQLYEQFISSAQIREINLREWLLKQQVYTAHTRVALDDLVAGFRTATPEDLEYYCWQILKRRLKATEALKEASTSPKSLAHYHWAFWLKDVMYRLEGVHRLLALSSRDLWGNGPVENPMDHIIALYLLRTGKFPKTLFDALHNDSLRETEEEVRLIASADLALAADVMAAKVVEVFDTLSTRNDFLSVLGRGCLFMSIWSQLGLGSRLLKIPLGSYICVYSDIDAQLLRAPFFLDFQRGGKRRSMAEVRDRLHATGSVKIQYGVSLYDILATTYTWHQVRSGASVVDLIEHAANEVQITALNSAPKLYSDLVDRVLKRSKARRFTMSPSVSPVEVAPDPGEWLQKGKVVQVTLDSESNKFGVVLEVGDGSVLVEINGDHRRVINSMVQPAPSLPLITVAGLAVPDVGLDIMSLGQHFVQYSVVRQRFE